MSVRSAIVITALSLSPHSMPEAQTLRIPDSLPPGVTAAMVLRGREIFKGKGNCHNCHGPDAMGLLGPNLTDGEWWDAKGTYLAILQLINTGVPIHESTRGIAMPPRGGSPIDDHDVQAVASWVWRVSHPGDSLRPPLTQDMVERGRQVFIGPGRCSTCHGREAKGDVGPNLTDAEWLHTKGSYLAIVGTVLSGVSSAKGRSGVEMPPRGGGRLTDAEVYAVAAYVWTLGRKAKQAR